MTTIEGCGGLGGGVVVMVVVVQGWG